MEDEIKIEYWWTRRLGIGRRECRWHVRDESNGEILCSSGEGYRNFQDMVATLDKLRRLFPAARLVIVTRP